MEHNKLKPYVQFDYYCENEELAQIIIPRKATKDDLCALMEMLEVLIKRKFGMATMKPITDKKKRKYYRKCGVCGERYEQGDMIRTNNSPNGWICFDCNNAEHPEYEDFGDE